MNWPPNIYKALGLGKNTVMNADEMMETGTQAQAPTDLVQPNTVDASRIISCMEVCISRGVVINPYHKDSGEEPARLDPSVLIEKMTKDGWVVARVMCYGDSSTNYGHEPAISHKTVVLMVKMLPPV